MNWSAQQEAALKDIAAWVADPSAPQVRRLFGWAGTGKSTLAQHFAEGVAGTVLFAAYTGKAASIMRQKGCPGATTIHSLIYHSKEKSRLQLQLLEDELIELLQEYRDIPEEEVPKIVELRLAINRERRNLAQPSFHLNLESKAQFAKLVIIDECSMVGGKMGEDLLSFGTKILALGDPAQLPPPFGAGYFTENVEPDIMLTDIHRQARDNPIIDLATRVRAKESLPLGNYGSSSVIVKASPEQAIAADQVLVGRNKTRHRTNDRLRELLGLTDPYPVPGDKLCCLRNNHDRGLMNGAIWHVVDTGDHDEETVLLTVKADGGDEELVVTAHTSPFLGGDLMDLSWQDRREAEEFAYGYALTVHKAQGSQWGNVLINDESDCFRAQRWRWLYTGITRAAESVVVVKGN